MINTPASIYNTITDAPFSYKELKCYHNSNATFCQYLRGNSLFTNVIMDGEINKIEIRERTNKGYYFDIYLIFKNNKEIKLDSTYISSSVKTDEFQKKKQLVEKKKIDFEQLLYASKSSFKLTEVFLFISMPLTLFFGFFLIFIWLLSLIGLIFCLSYAYSLIFNKK